LNNKSNWKTGDSHNFCIPNQPINREILQIKGSKKTVSSRKRSRNIKSAQAKNEFSFLTREQEIAEFYTQFPPRSLDEIRLIGVLPNKDKSKINLKVNPNVGSQRRPKLGPAENFTQRPPQLLKSQSEHPQEIFDAQHENIEVWTDKGWSKIKYLMRHKTQKEIYRVFTNTGMIDVTEDHSLLDEFAEPIKPTEISLGDKLLHHDLENNESFTADMDEEKAWLWGFFMAEGTCGYYTEKGYVASAWSISNQNHYFLNKAQMIARRVEPEYDFVIDPCMESSKADKLNPRGDNIKNLSIKYESLFYTKRSTVMCQNEATDLGIRFKKVPDQILMAPLNIKAAFFQGWYDGDGAKTDKGRKYFDIKGQIGAAGLFNIASALGYKVVISDRDDKAEIYRVRLNPYRYGKHPDRIKKITSLGFKDEYVYDIETENHHFAAGPGRMVVHNSVMMHIPAIKDPKECDYWGNKLAEEISGIKPGAKDCDGNYYPKGRPGLFPPPLAMEFEKAMRVLSLRKKKYASFYITKDGTFKTEDIINREGKVVGSKLAMLKKGIVLARRDNCLTSSSMVTMANGTSRSIKDLVNNTSKVYGWDGAGLSTANQTAFKYQGKQKCITLQLADGRKITCTPDHRFLVKLPDDSIVWKEAHTITREDRVVCGLEAPEDIVGEDEANWSLTLGNQTFDLKPNNRDRTLALMRILGMINADGSVNQREDNRIDSVAPLGHMIDANAFVDDIELVCGIRPAITNRTTAISSFYQVRVPNLISELFLTIQVQDIGRRSNQESSWPLFLLDVNCPRAVLREFCGGFFGSDGISPCLSKTQLRCDPHKMEQSSLIGQSTRLQHQENQRQKMIQLCDILERAGYKGATLSNRVEIYSVNKHNRNPENLRAMFRILPSSDHCDFLQKIGYRYCIHKQVRHTAAQTMWRYEETIKKDRMRTMILGKQIKDTNKVTYQVALDRAKAQIINDPSTLYPEAIQAIGHRMFSEFCREGPVSDLTLKRYCELPKTVDWLTDIGALSWFDQHGYGVSRDTMSVPVLYLRLHNIVDAGDQDVYDISVDRLESFVANGIVVHNCPLLRKTYTRILEMIMHRCDIDVALAVLVDAIQDLLDGKVPVEDLVTIRELGANYKSDSFFMKVFSDNLKKAGKLVNPGDRLDFVIVQDPNAKLLGDKMRLLEQYYDSLETEHPERIDYDYYISKALMNPINQLFEVGFKDIIPKLNIGYKPSSRHKPIYLDRPVHMILKMREHNIDIQKLKIDTHRIVQQLKQPPRLTLNVISDPPPQPPNDPPLDASINSTPNTRINPQRLSLNIIPEIPVMPTIPTIQRNIVTNLQTTNKAIQPKLPSLKKTPSKNKTGPKRNRKVSTQPSKEELKSSQSAPDSLPQPSDPLLQSAPQTKTRTPTMLARIIKPPAPIVPKCAQVKSQPRIKLNIIT
jgi:intein/homing endonuclease